jgi:branched-chain amino acid transport system substrate-binding protein
VNDRINTDNLDTNDEGGRVLKNRDIIQDENKQSIKVAIILPLSGDNQGTGERLAKSIPLIENLNGNFQYDKQFGLQYQFDITIKDDGCDIEKAKKIARDIVANGKYLFVIGHFCSGASQAVAPIYERAGIVQITPFSTEPSLTERGYKTFFRLAGRNDRYGEVAADWLHEFRNRYKLATINRLLIMSLSVWIYVPAVMTKKNKMIIIQHPLIYKNMKKISPNWLIN